MNNGESSQLSEYELRAAIVVVVVVVWPVVDLVHVAAVLGVVVA